MWGGVARCAWRGPLGLCARSVREHVCGRHVPVLVSAHERLGGGSLSADLLAPDPTTALVCCCAPLAMLSPVQRCGCTPRVGVRHTSLWRLPTNRGRGGAPAPSSTPTAALPGVVITVSSLRIARPGKRAAINPAPPPSASKGALLGEPGRCSVQIPERVCSDHTSLVTGACLRPASTAAATWRQKSNARRRPPAPARGQARKTTASAPALPADSSALRRALGNLSTFPLGGIFRKGSQVRRARAALMPHHGGCSDTSNVSTDEQALASAL